MRADVIRAYLFDVMQSVERLSRAVADWQVAMPLSARIVDASKELGRATKRLHEQLKMDALSVALDEARERAVAVTLLGESPEAIEAALATYRQASDDWTEAMLARVEERRRRSLS